MVATPALAATNYDVFSSVVDIEPDATLEVVETITGSFDEPRHGIFRNIPYQYRTAAGTNQTIGITVEAVGLFGRAEPYEISRSGGYETIKIGRASETFSGPFEYTIRYRVDRAILYHADTDELYWNVSGSNWEGAFSTVNATVRVSGVAAEALDVSCYTGEAGSTAMNCDARVADGNVSVVADDFLTVSVSFPKGIVSEPTQLDRAKQLVADNVGIFSLLVPIAAFAFLLSRWRKNGKDAKGRGTIIAEYEPPDSLRPTEVGTLVDATVHDRDVSAAIVDLAVRGYLQIIEDETKVLFVTSKSYRLKRLKPDDATLKPFEVALMLGLFGSDEEVKLTDRRSSMVVAKKKIEKAVYEEMATLGYYAKNPTTVRTTYFGFAILAGFVTYIGGGIVANQVSGGVFVYVAGFATAAMIAVFGLMMPKKTEAGAVACEKALGFKLYLETAEKYRIQWQEREKIFEKFLPYAMVFGVADKWSKALADVAREQPSWYVGNYAAFSAIDFSHRVNAFSSAAAAVAAPKSSGGSGGSGSSGGGFGGGGGGSW